MKYLPWVLLLVALFAWTRAEQREGRHLERIAQLETRSAQVDTVYVRDTLTLTKVRRITDSVVSTDTVIRADTVLRWITLEREACDRVIQTCEQRVAYRDSIIKELKKKPSVFSKLPWLVGGYLLHEVVH